MSRRRSHTGSPPAGATDPLIAFVAAWEFECCGTPLRCGDTVWARREPFDGELPWDAPGPVEWLVELHAEPDPDRCLEATVLLIWEAWQPPAGSLALHETWRTAPFSGSEHADAVPRPDYVAPGDSHLGWILSLTG